MSTYDVKINFSFFEGLNNSIVPGNKNQRRYPSILHNHMYLTADPLFSCETAPLMSEMNRLSRCWPTFSRGCSFNVLMRKKRTESEINERKWHEPPHNELVKSGLIWLVSGLAESSVIPKSTRPHVYYSIWSRVLPWVSLQHMISCAAMSVLTAYDHVCCHECPYIIWSLVLPWVS